MTPGAVNMVRRAETRELESALRVLEMVDSEAARAWKRGITEEIQRRAGTSVRKIRIVKT